jgi:4-carboxymuconolactone decarboxylase
MTMADEGHRRRGRSLPQALRRGRPGRRDFHVICVMEAVPARPTMERNTALLPDRPLTPRRRASVPVIPPGARAAEGSLGLDYTERLRRLAINDPHGAEESTGGAGARPRELDPKTLALVRLAALIAVGGAVPSYGAQADAAVDAGATAAEIVDVLVGVIPIVGLPIVVATAPKLAMALGYDTNDAFEQRSDE